MLAYNIKITFAAVNVSLYNRISNDRVSELTLLSLFLFCVVFAFYYYFEAIFIFFISQIYSCLILKIQSVLFGSYL